MRAVPWPARLGLMMCLLLLGFACSRSQSDERSAEPIRPLEYAVARPVRAVAEVPIPQFGINNPSDMELTRQLGAQIVKVFPMNWADAEPIPPNPRRIRLQDLGEADLGISDLPAAFRDKVKSTIRERSAQVQQRPGLAELVDYQQDERRLWHMFVWEKFDERVRSAQQAGLQIMFNMTFNTIWASDRTALLYRAQQDTDGYNAPLKDADQVDHLRFFVQALVERYDGDGKNDMPGLKQPLLFWEDGNEYNVPRFWQGTNAQYLTMWQAFSEGVRAADPRAQVVANGINSVEEVRECAGPDGQFSAVATLENWLRENRAERPEFLQGEKAQTWAQKLRELEQNRRGSIPVDELVEMARAAGIPDKALAKARQLIGWKKRSVDFFHMQLDHPELYDIYVPHFYTFYKYDPHRIHEDMTFLKQEMSKRGYSKPMMVLEVSGAHLGPAGDAPEADAILQSILDRNRPDHRQKQQWYFAHQATELVKVHALLFAEGIDGIVWYHFRDIPTTLSWSTSSYAIEGLITLDENDELATKKPAFYTYQLLTSKLTGFQRATLIGREVIRFDFADRPPVYVAWNEAGSVNTNFSREITAATCRVTPIITQLDPRQRPVVPAPRVVPAGAVPLSEVPVFIESL